MSRASDPSDPPQEVIDDWIRACNCCEDCGLRPCAGVQQGAPCDDACRCEDREEEDDYDPNACPGCGGNCQAACR